MVKRLSTMWETSVRSLGQEEPLEKEMAIHSITIAWKIPWAEDLGRLQSMGLRREEWQDILKVMKEKNPQSRLLYLARISFKYEGEIKSFIDKQKLR